MVTNIYWSLVLAFLISSSSSVTALQSPPRLTAQQALAAIGLLLILRLLPILGLLLLTGHGENSRFQIQLEDLEYVWLGGRPEHNCQIMGKYLKATVYVPT